jgi:hypothetical protein
MHKQKLSCYHSIGLKTLASAREKIAHIERELKGMKGIVLILCSLIGYLVSRFIPDGPLAVYLPLLISYHLLLAFLVVTSVQDKGISLPIGSTVLTHIACLALLVVFAEARDHIPYFSIIRFFTPSIAMFEASWLFSGKARSERAVVEADAPSGGTAEDYEDFILYLRQNERQFSKPGRSVKEEYKSWLAHRAKHPVMHSGQRSAY